MTILFPSLERDELKILQVNIGYKCNQTCSHCHVNAGPNRWEMMDEETINLIPLVIKEYGIKVLDITGGAPEMHPKFKELINKARKLNVNVIDRCNLTILSEPGHEDTTEFLANNNVEVIASLPCYLKENVDKQRGKGVFERSIYGLKKLNQYGYGKEDSSLVLNLVYNPQGAILPPSQKGLEDSYRKILYNEYGIHFTKLLALANMPINRFATYLRSIGMLDIYQKLLEESHNPNNLKSVMCINSISVDWQGNLYDCDFNQQIGLKSSKGPKKLLDLLKNNVNLKGNPIAVASHCFGCTAGSGSSCGGALTL